MIRPCSDTGLSQIIPCSPHKVSDQVRILLHHLPVLRQILWKCLASHDDPLRMELSFLRVAPGGVIVSRNINRIQNRSCDQICLLSVCRFRHSGTYHRGDHIEHGTVHARGLLLIGIISSPVFLVHGFAFCRICNDRQIEPACDRTAVVQFVEQFCHRPCQIDALFLCRFADLISDRIHDHGRMVVVPLYESLDILPVMLFKFICIVIRIFLPIPHIPCLIHHIHSKPVTCS